MNLPVKYLANYVGQPLRRGSAHAAGIDLAAAASPTGNWCIPHDSGAIVSTGVAVAIPDGYYGRVVMRSGHGFKHDLFCHVGTIDSDYRGELKVKVFNFTGEDHYIGPGERFAQLIIQPYLACEPVAAEDLAATARGADGFGSTGV